MVRIKEFVKELAGSAIGELEIFPKFIKNRWYYNEKKNMCLFLLQHHKL